MSLTKLLIAAVVLLGLGGLVYWVQKNPQDKNTAATANSPKLMDVSEAQVQSLEIAPKAGTPIELQKQNNKWMITAPESYSADPDATTTMISSLSGVTADSVIDEKPGDVAKYGLKDPALVVTAHEKNGKDEQIFFGDDVPASSLVYVRVGKDPKVYAASTSLRTSFTKTVNDLRDKRLLRFDPTQVSQVEIAAPKSDVVFGKVNQSEWQVVKPQPSRADSFQVEDVLRKLADAKMDLSGKPEEAKASESAFNTGTVVAAAKVTDAGGVQTLDVRQNKDDYYARSSAVPGSFKISADLGKLLSKPVDDFRNKKIFDFGFSDVARLEIQQPSGDKVYTRSGTDWKLNGKKMDPGQVQSVIDKLRDLAATTFPVTGFGSADTTITVVSNDGKRTEKAQFSKVGDGFIGRREEQPTLYKLDAKPVDDILEAAAAIKVAAPATKK